MVSGKHRTSSPQSAAYPRTFGDRRSSLFEPQASSSCCSSSLSIITSASKQHDLVQGWLRQFSQQCDCPHPRLQTLHQMEHLQRAKDHLRRAHPLQSDEFADDRTRDHHLLRDLREMERYHETLIGRVRSSDKDRWPRDRGKSL